MRAVEIYVSGIVQGVGFRYFTTRIARELGIKGFVKNLPDGRVYIYAVGEEESLEKFISTVRQGPPLAVVRDVEVRNAEVREFERFEVKR
ncbi:MAG: acylphosphatase [Archaeoglobi archaeon]|jgi:acylphosphatase|nr:MAG: acylphosphatase [Archaeoglobi archaeon]TDA27864.1 MAG: acylphosphatase [Archaeoglobi archaeon]TDA30736.1 MAG: acylphosphatase [Archaeoglobi archaeon]